MGYPSPIGNMQLIPISDAILESRAARGGQSETELIKIKAIDDHIMSNKYCEHLIRKGLMKTCEDPVAPIFGDLPSVEAPMPVFKDENYVYSLTSEPY